MKIVLTGVETNNKGAELMLYAILQEVERRHPDAEVYLHHSALGKKGRNYIKTNVRLKYWPCSRIINMLHINSILYRLHFPLIVDTRAVKADYFMDGSGFLFSDQCKLWNTTPLFWEKLLRRLYNYGTKIVFLPQAFGPFKLDETKAAMASLGRYSSVIMPREQVSLEYVKKTGLVNDEKLHKFTDFTSLVEGSFPEMYLHLKDGICIIPNMNMIRQGIISYDDYIKLLTSILRKAKESGHPVYMLNHEGRKDEELILKCQTAMNGEIDVVTGLNALEVKGLISTAYVVITSRFHGLASALNCCVPSLATSWSHKYEELYRDYGMDNYVLPLNDHDSAMRMLSAIMDTEENSKIRAKLSANVPAVKEQTREMWNLVWSL